MERLRDVCPFDDWRRLLGSIADRLETLARR
jgi:hypothetical protein